MPSFSQLRPEETMREKVSLHDGFPLGTSSLRRIALGYTLLWWALLLCASLAPGSYWFTGSAEASPASQVMCACAVLTPFFIPFVVYFPALQTKWQLSPFDPTRLSTSKTTRGYWERLVSCLLTTLMPLFSVYALFAVMSWLGFLKKDLVTPVLLGLVFLIFVVELTLLTSLTSIGLAMSDSRMLHLIATAIGGLAVMLPIILSAMVTGTSLQNHLVRFVQAVGQSSAVLIVLLLSSLLVGSLFSWLYGHQKL